MTWESAVIIGLCSLNLILLLTRRPSPAVQNPPTTKDWKPSDGRIPLTDPDPYKAAPEPKDNGSVILLTAERDARLLEGQDD